MGLIGHNKQKKYFKYVIGNGALSHAYLFTGPEMIGKKMLALELFETINKRSYINDPDFIFVGPNLSEGESKIHIEDIRKLKSFFRFKPYAGPYKMAVIDDANCFTDQAANALLKIIEEPPKFSVIILTSSMPGLIPSTIVSRCEKVRFNEATEKETADYLIEKKVNKEDREFLVKFAGGRIGLVNRLIEGDGMAEAKRAVDDLRKLFNSGIYEKMSYAKKIHEKALRHSSGQGGYQPLVGYWLNWVSAHLRNSPKNEKIVKNLLSLNQIVSQPQFNHRLALENFLLNL
ncbi:MAG: hypothetical protein Q7S43_04395 [bacterium]|nr:hypothetical protein [bacterium]